MTATVEAEAPTGRLDRLRTSLIEQSERLHKLDEFIAAGPIRERRLLDEHLARSSSPPGAIGPVEEHRRKLRDAVKSRPAVQANVDALNAAVIAEEEKQRTLVLADIQVEVDRYQGLIRGAIRGCAGKVSEFNDAYVAYTEVVAEFDQFRESKIARISNDGDKQAHWRDTVAHLVMEFAPGDLLQMFLDIYEVACDPTGAGWRKDLYPEARPYDDRDELRKLTPDLREAEGRLRLSRSDRVRYSQRRSIQGMNL